jgi:hypothetical protein
MQMRQCPLCHREHEVADDGTIPTWTVIWEGQDIISQRSSNFIHKEDAISEYNWIAHRLIDAALWEKNKDKLRLEEGERASWADLFEEPGIYQWEA